MIAVVDPVGILLAVAFIAGVVLLIPLNERLQSRRERSKRRYHAHLKRKEGRW